MREAEGSSKKFLKNCDIFLLKFNNRINECTLNQDEFILIIKEHQKLIYKICHSYCADPQQRKDLEQEILLQLWVSMQRYTGTVKLSTWMYRVALNTAIGFLPSGSQI